MSESKADLLLHPIRMRVVQALMAHKRMTAGQIAAVLGDVPPATLYRHINKLAESGIVSVVEQRQVRGAAEKIYALSDLVDVTPADLAGASRAEHMRYFTAYAATLLGEFGRYLQQDQPDLLADGVSYRQAPLYLTDAEFQAFITRLRDLYLEYMALPPAPERRHRSLFTIIIPEPQPRKTTP